MNSDKLKALMVMNHDTQSMLAEALGITRESLNQKINEVKGRCFDKREIQEIIRRYRLTQEETAEIFFPNEVS